MDVIPCGTTIVSKIAGIEGMIIAIKISFAQVDYDITFFIDGNFRNIWMNENEFDIKTTNRQPIGFKINNGQS